MIEKGRMVSVGCGGWIGSYFFRKLGGCELICDLGLFFTLGFGMDAKSYLPPLLLFFPGTIPMAMSPAS